MDARPEREAPAMEQLCRKKENLAMNNPEKTLENVKEYYGKTLKGSQDLQSNACCAEQAVPHLVKEALQNIHPEILEKSYGCGSPIPSNIKGKTVLDLGCGTGRDCYVLSQLVGPHGNVIGVDMTEEQLAIATEHLTYHMRKFSYKKPNVVFYQGYIENLKSLHIANQSIDRVVSNCVINLSPDKRRVFSEIFRVLRDNGELYFSDIFSDRPIPDSLKADPLLYGECLSGALSVGDFQALIEEIGFLDSHVVSSSPLTINNKEIQKKVGDIAFLSMTVSVFKEKQAEKRSGTSCC
jgi:arsenite methyltransferase